MPFISDLTCSQCLDEISTIISEKTLYGYAKKTIKRSRKNLSGKFLVHKKVRKYVPYRAPINVYISGRIDETGQGTCIDIKVLYGFKSFWEILVLAMIDFAIVNCSSMRYDISHGFILSATVLVTGFVIAITYLWSKYSYEANELKKDLLDMVKRILRLREKM